MIIDLIFIQCQLDVLAILSDLILYLIYKYISDYLIGKYTWKTKGCGLVLVGDWTTFSVKKEPDHLVII